MNKITALENAVNSRLGSSEWTSANVKTLPANLKVNSTLTEFVRVDYLVGDNDVGTSTGMVILDLFTEANKGLARSNQLAQLLCNLFNKKTIAGVQFFQSSFQHLGLDKDNPGLYRSKVSVNVKYFEVT